MAKRGTRRGAERTLALQTQSPRHANETRLGLVSNFLSPPGRKPRARGFTRVLHGIEKRVETVKTANNVVNTDCKTRDNRENRAICLKKKHKKISFPYTDGTSFTVTACFAIGFHNGLHGFRTFLYAVQRARKATRAWFAAWRRKKVRNEPQ